MHWLREQFRKQPILMGCLTALLLAGALACGGGILMVVGGVALFQKATDAAGISSPIELNTRAAEAGWGVGMERQSGGDLVIRLSPLEPKASLTCEQAWTLVGPSLSGTAETLEVQAWASMEDALADESPRWTCRWTGRPQPSETMPSPGFVAGSPAPPTPLPSETAPEVAPPGTQPAPETGSAPGPTP